MRAGETGKGWTIGEEKKLVRLYRTKTSRELAKAFGRTKQAIESRLNKLRAAGKLTAKSDVRHWTPQEDRKLLQFSTSEAASKVGRSVEACRQRKSGLKQRVRGGRF